MQVKKMKERRDAGQDEQGKEGCRTRRRRKEWMQDKTKKERRDAGQDEEGKEGCRTGGRGAAPWVRQWLVVMTGTGRCSPRISRMMQSFLISFKEKSELGAADGEARKPLTEEERKERLVQMEELRKKKRAERETREKQEVRESERD